MKTKELISRLQNADPTGEIQCCIDNADIWSIEVEPAYYDGSLHVIDFDEDRRPIKGRRIRSGEKVVLSPIRIQDCFEYNFEVEYLTEEDRKRNEAFDIEERRHDKQIHMDVERDHFVEWVFMKIQNIRKVPLGWVDRMKAAAVKFFEENCMGPDTPFVKVPMGRSYNDCREEYYEDTIFVDWDNYSRIIIKMKEKQTA